MYHATMPKGHVRGTSWNGSGGSAGHRVAACPPGSGRSGVPPGSTCALVPHHHRPVAPDGGDLDQPPHQQPDGDGPQRYFWTRPGLPLRRPELGLHERSVDPAPRLLAGAVERVDWGGEVVTHRGPPIGWKSEHSHSATGQPRILGYSHGHGLSLAVGHVGVAAVAARGARAVHEERVAAARRLVDLVEALGQPQQGGARRVTGH